ncbi:LuxR family transcriptional regulator [Leifsonia sp. NPDC077715]|uniref:LuxR family transcriptional regulator n=1 Tax=Leifsonia sp. NPDC077715 TaxID=3155539 RepID=UPI00342A74BF
MPPSNAHQLASYRPTLDFERTRLVERIVGDTERRAAVGTPSLVSLRGDAGQGKSTILEAVLAEVKRRGSSVIRMSGSPLAAGMPYAALYEMVTDPSNRLGRTGRGLADQLASFRGGASPLAVARAVGACLQELDGRAVLLVDDADLVDEDSLRVVAFAAARYSPAPTSVIYALTRTVPLLDRLQVTQLRLDDLHQHDAERLAVESGAHEAAAPHLVARLGGNPLALRFASPAFPYRIVGDDLGVVPVAARLESDVDARMESLGQDERRLLIGSAVTGERDVERLSAYLAETSESLDDALDGVEGSGLVEVHHGELHWHRMWMTAAVARRCGPDRRARLTAILRGSGDVAHDADAVEDRPTLLTSSERRVVEVIVAGASVKEAADTLSISSRTVGSHLQSAYRKLGIHSRSQLAALMLTGAGAHEMPL